MPNVSRQLCESAQLRPGTARSVKGQVIWVSDAKPDNASLRARVVVVVGAIHGDEQSSAALAFHWIRLAEQTLADPPQVIPWRFFPVLNPDGVLSQPPLRVNGCGVGLNRNFPHAQLDA